MNAFRVIKSYSMFFMGMWFFFFFVKCTFTIDDSNGKTRCRIFLLERFGTRVKMVIESFEMSLIQSLSAQQGFLSTTFITYHLTHTWPSAKPFGLKYTDLLEFEKYFNAFFHFTRISFKRKLKYTIYTVIKYRYQSFGCS